MRRWFDDKENFFEGCTFKFGNSLEPLKPFPTCETCDKRKTCVQYILVDWENDNVPVVDFCSLHQDFK